jgi:molybdopterin-dependent oxidoreductase alpha subunit
MEMKPSFKPYTGPSGGWGSARSVQNILRRQDAPVSTALALTQQNKPDGFQCVSCAWIKPADPLPFEFCENGAKATAWDLTAHRARPDFFARHTVSELLRWSDYDLEQVGRLTRPMRYDPVQDRYREVSWDVAFAEIGHELRAIADRKRAVFYSSGRTSNEASYLYGLFARAYGNNNLPDSSNMCHETTSIALPASIGVPVGTVHMEDFATTECLFFFGQNPGTNSPRMLHPLQDAAKRGCPIITFNPLRERGLETFTDPQSPVEMITREETRISSHYYQVKTGGDLAAIAGICKALVELDDTARRDSNESVIDHAFIAEHTHGFDRFLAWLGQQDWALIETEAGLHRSALRETAAVYARAKSAIAVYGMGLTQHRAGVDTVRMLVNLLLMRGNIGKEGAGISPIRGHSNVQGQRTVGITEKPSLVPMDKLRAQFGFEPPEEEGLTTVDACEEILGRRIDAFFMLGGNFLRAVPDQDRMEAAWRDMRLTISLATKINRSHLFPGTVSYVLPVLSRLERDRKRGVDQLLSMEDTSAHIHASRGLRAPASKHLKSEVEIICRIAMATLDANPLMPWQDWMEDYSFIRDAIAETYPAIFHGYNTRMRDPKGIEKPLPARKREWHTPSGRAEFVTPEGLGEDSDMPSGGSDVLRMMTLRSNDQFNTTIYGYDDRFRGIRGTRMVVLMNEDDIARLGLSEGEEVSLETVSNDGIDRAMGGFRVTLYNVPPGCIGTYYPEANALVPLGHYAKGSKTPASKSVPVRVVRGQRAAHRPPAAAPAA